MQTKSSYRLLKWTLLVGTVASLATACVVTSGDGTGGDAFGGEGATTSTAGTAALTGGSSTAGTTTTGGGGSSSTAGTNATAGTTTTPEGGAAAYVAGACDNDAVTPTMNPSCDPSDNDTGDAKACKRCLKSKCCETWQACYADTPTIACGFGATDADPGQFDCMQNCFVDGAAAATGTADMLLSDCADKCTNQCADADGGNVMGATSDLITCANDAATCQDVCFPFNQ